MPSKYIKILIVISCCLMVASFLSGCAVACTVENKQAFSNQIKGFFQKIADSLQEDIKNNTSTVLTAVAVIRPQVQMMTTPDCGQDVKQAFLDYLDKYEADYKTAQANPAVWKNATALSATFSRSSQAQLVLSQKLNTFLSYQAASPSSFGAESLIVPGIIGAVILVIVLLFAGLFLVLRQPSAPRPKVVQAPPPARPAPAVPVYMSAPTPQVPQQPALQLQPIPQPNLPPPPPGYTYAPIQPQSSSGLTALDTIMMIMLVLLGLFWMGVGGLQLALGFNLKGALSDLFCTGVWNFFIGIVNLYMIREVIAKKKRGSRDLIFLAVVGFVWGFISVFFFAAWLQILVIPLYVILGVLAQISRPHYVN